MKRIIHPWLVALVIAGCSSNSPPAGDDDGDDDPLAGTTQLDIPVSATTPTYIKLSSSSVVTPAGDPATSLDWDLAITGYAITTDSGVSGAGTGGAFGPFDLDVMLDDAAPEYPFLSADEAGGAFLDWYAYDGAAHVLYSRFHVYGIQREARLWKVQVLQYYGLDTGGTPTSALYKVRFAEITSGVGATQELDVDGTAGGLAATGPSGCLDLASATVTPLTVEETQTSTTWDLCFRRDKISVNGEIGGPSLVGALDLEASATADEKLADIMAETAATQLPVFDGVDATSFAGAKFRGDHVVSAFEAGSWVDTTTTPPTLSPDHAWLVVDASYTQAYLLTFTEFQGATAGAPGTVVTHLKPVTGGL